MTKEGCDECGLASMKMIHAFEDLRNYLYVRKMELKKDLMIVESDRIKIPESEKDSLMTKRKFQEIQAVLDIDLGENIPQVESKCSIDLGEVKELMDRAIDDAKNHNLRGIQDKFDEASEILFPK